MLRLLQEIKTFSKQPQWAMFGGLPSAWHATDSGGDGSGAAAAAHGSQVSSSPLQAGQTQPAKKRKPETENRIIKNVAS